MELGYDGKLYILAFDHRGSFQKKMFGIQGDPSEEETRTISDAKHLIYEGMVKAVERGAEAGAAGGPGGGEFGGEAPTEAQEPGPGPGIPGEKDRPDEVHFQDGGQF